MKKNYFVKSSLVLMGFAILLLVSCKPKTKREHIDLGKVQIDSSLLHLLQPVNRQVEAKLPVVKALYETKIFTVETQGIVNYDNRSQYSIASRVSGRIERLLIKYNYQPIKKGQLIMEVYSPDLAAAQQELLFLKKNDREGQLLTQAKQRLLLLGMSASSIQQVLSSEKINYRIPVYSPVEGYILERSANNTPVVSASTSVNAAAGEGMAGMGGSPSAVSTTAVSAVPVNTPLILREGQYVSAGQTVFTIYNAKQLVAEFSLKPDLATLVRRGSKLAFYKTVDKENTLQMAHIGMIQPVFKDGEQFSVARVYLNQSEMHVGDLLTAKIPVLLPKSGWLPETAVINLGGKNIVFSKEANVFIPKEVRTGIKIARMIQVMDDIGHLQIAKNAAYLVDSESFIKIKP
jgi:membrane fusion protein, copper/silver efflux system